MSDAAAQVADLVFETAFVRRFDDPLPRPQLVEALEGEPGHYRARVVSDRCFSDGRPLNARRLAAGLSRGRALGDGEWVSARGDTLELHSSLAKPALEAALAHSVRAIVARDESQAPVGTGPYRVAEHEPNRMVLEPNEHGAQTRHFERIEFRSFADDELLREALAEGSVDLSFDVALEEGETLRGTSRRVLDEASTAILFLNTQRPALQGVAARRVLAHALDCAELASMAHDPGVARAKSLLPAMLGIHAQATDVWDQVDEDEMDGSPLDGATLRMVLPWGPRGYLAEPWRVGETLAEQLAMLGALVLVEPAASPTEALRRAMEGDYDLFLAGWSCDTPEPIDFLEALLHSDAVPSGKDASRASAGPTSPSRPLALSCNLGRIRSTLLDDALGAYALDPTPAALESVHRAIRATMPLVPICHGKTTVVLRDGLADFRLVGPRLPDFASLRWEEG